METASIPNRIKVASHELDEARNALDDLLQAAKVSSRAETTLVTQVVQAALDRIRAAQASLLELQEMLASPDE